MASEAEARKRAFEIIREKSFVRGEITLASGKKSDHYFDMKPSMLDPEGATLLSGLLLDRLEGLNADYVGGIEMGAVPLIGPVAMQSFQRGRRPIPAFFVRKSVKDHGTRKLIEGVKDLARKRVAIVEDVTTTGGSAMLAVNALREAGATVAVVLSIVDREDGAAELFAKEGIAFEPLFSSREFLAAR
jgi:orotate phosphoribosyltransferase